MHRHLLITLILCFGATLFGQATSTKTLISSIHNKLESAENLESTLSFQQFFGDDESPIMKGKFYSQAGMMRLELPQLTFIADNKNTYTYYPERNEVYMDNKTSAEGLPAVENLTDMFTYLFSDEFEYQKVEDIDNEHLVVQFVPKSDENDYARAFMTINTATILPTNLEVHMRDASSFQINLSEVLIDQESLDSDLFIFDVAAYPEVIVEDLRLD